MDYNMATGLIWRSCFFVVCGGVFFSTSDATAGQENEENEFCQRETMAIRCRWKSEVIVMTSARWGRMKPTRCLNIHANFLAIHGHDRLFLGCSEDVMSIVDSECSGRSECDFRIQDHLDPITPCYPDLARYLSTSFMCVRVVQESRTCTLMATVEEQYLTGASPTSPTAGSMSSCGTTSHPWHIEAPTGQRINISILDFTAYVGELRDHQLPCREYGYVTEKPTKKNISLCDAVGGVTHQRDTFVYTSDINSVDIVLVTGTNAAHQNFLVKLNAVGCTNMLPPENGWISRSKNDILAGCYLSQQTWQLKCDGHEWKGQVGTCPGTFEGTIPTSVEVRENTDDTLMVRISMAIIAFAAVCVCIVVVGIGCFCTKRYRFKSDTEFFPISTKSKQRLMLSGRSGDEVQGRSNLNKETPSAVDACGLTHNRVAGRIDGLSHEL